MKSSVKKGSLRGVPRLGPRLDVWAQAQRRSRPPGSVSICYSLKLVARGFIGRTHKVGRSRGHALRAMYISFGIS